MLTYNQLYDIIFMGHITDYMNGRREPNPEVNGSGKLKPVCYWIYVNFLIFRKGVIYDKNY